MFWIYIILIYTSHILTVSEIMILTFADDTALLATSNKQTEANPHLQSHLNLLKHLLEK